MNARIKKKREKCIRRYKACTIYGMKITSYRKLKICRKFVRALVNSIESRLNTPYNIKLQTKRRNRRHAVDITRRRNTQK
jgi:ribosomal protein S14